MATSFSKNKQRKNTFKKFIGNKTDGQGFADKRKKKAYYEYQKLKKKLNQKTDTEKNRPKTNKKRTAFSKAESAREIAKQEKKKKQQETLQSQAERHQALKQYETRKRKKHLKMCKRNFKGQPVMANQIDMLLEKIQSS